LRNQVNPECTFEEFLNEVKETLSEALDNQIYPFDRLVDELDVERIPNRNPLFDVMAAWMITDGMRLKLDFNGIELTGLEFNLTKSMFDLSFLFTEDEGKISYAIEFNTSLFKRERIQRMSEHFETLIKSIIKEPKKKIKNLEIIPAGEKEKLLFGFNETNHPHGAENNVLDLFSYRAEVNKNNIALVHGEREITYDEMGKLSNRIANHIIEHVSPGKDDIIAIIINDPVLSVASIIAIMKTGAAYLPIMSDDPPERIRFIIKDSNSKAVLVDNNLLNSNSGLSADSIENVLIINIEESLNENPFFPDKKVEKDSLAYVIYTSGSTGLPKGVMIEHRSLSNLVASLNINIYSHYEYPLDELMISSFAFDVSVKQIFTALCNGNTLHVLNKNQVLDSREIINYIVNSKINIVDLTPSLFSVMLEEGFGEAVKPDLKEIFLGSEALPFKLIKNFYRFENNKKIHMTNFYGPTECCVESSYFKLYPDMLENNYDITPIGKPILNEQIYILDKFLNLCPIGVPGEICIAGKGLARQYLNDPEKTKENFVQFPLLNGIRIYRTGDKGRILPDGNVEFLGRMDTQVKLRGYRIELHEIEKRILELREIKECIVTLYSRNGSGELSAYFTSDEVIDTTKIKNHLLRFLPGYMIPYYFTRLENIPLSDNGKVDRNLLPDPVSRRKKEKPKSPQDEIDSSIQRIYSDVLKKDDISLEDNFFEIGGHSLNAVRVISRIQKEFGVNLALKEIFYNPVLNDIALKVKELINAKKSFTEKSEGEKTIVPASEEELILLSNLHFENEE
ncbi:MAG TPA: amino acid adenylation domain-containing protein, partial [Ignavibacteriaceae bacterium]|nr:amino acid adenylation domain-containing protein [Ignavibacteriaceae bacterium]